MAGKWCEGDPVSVAAIDSPATHTDWNELNAQGINGFEARAIPILFVPSGSDWMRYSNVGGGGDQWYWKNANSTALEAMSGYVPLRTGEKITEMFCTVSGSATGGWIKLRRKQIITTQGIETGFPNFADVAGGDFGSDPWSTSSKYDRLTLSSLSIIIESGYEYIIEVVAPTPVSQVYLGSFVVIPQWHNT